MGKASRLRRERKQVRQDFKFDLAKFLELYRQVAPAVIYECFRDVRCCLNATRVFIDVAEVYGLTAEPVQVRMMAMNAIQWRAINELGDAPMTPELSQKWLQSGAYMSVCDGTNEVVAEGWVGHLVAVVGNVMVDSSSRQFSRPLKDLTVPDVCNVEVPINFVTDRKMVMFEVHGGGVLSYQPVSNPPTYTRMSGFQRHEGNLDAARRIILAIDGLLPKQWRARSLPKSAEA